MLLGHIVNYVQSGKPCLHIVFCGSHRMVVIKKHACALIVVELVHFYSRVGEQGKVEKSRSLFAVGQGVVVGIMMRVIPYAFISLPVEPTGWISIFGWSGGDSMNMGT